MQIPVFNVNINIIYQHNFNVNGLSTPTERQAVRVVKKNELYVVFRKPSLNIKTYQLKVKGEKK